MSSSPSPSYSYPGYSQSSGQGMEYQRQFVAGPNYMDYDHQSQIISTQSGPGGPVRPGGPINLPSLASSLKPYNNPMHKGMQKQMSHSPHHKPPSLHAIRHDVVMRDKEKEADKAKKKGNFV